MRFIEIYDETVEQPNEIQGQVWEGPHVQGLLSLWSWGASLPKYMDVLPDLGGDGMEALSHRHDRSLTSCSALSLLKILGWG